jgi:F0F1-type ATP synthase membrane subunit b/b'
MDTLFDLSSFIIQAINFAIVFLVLRSFIFKPYMRYLEEETLKREELDSKLKQSESLLVTAKSDAEKLFDQSKIDAKMVARDLLK